MAKTEDTLTMETPMTDGTRAAFGGFIGAIIGGFLMDGMGVAVGVAVGVSLGVLLGADREWITPPGIGGAQQTINRRGANSLRQDEETIQQRLTELTLEAVGHYGAPFLRDLKGGNLGIGPDHAERLAGDYFNGRKTSIYGGSNEIQRNIIAKAVLGL